MSKIKVGIIGCGNISSIYMKNIPRFDHLELVACADIDINKAYTQAKKYRIPKVYSVKDLLEDPNIDLIINLTIPQAHAEVAIVALKNGKHVYGEKPLAVTREEGEEILSVAKEAGLLVGSSPDTFLGAGIQTAIHLIESGEIGVPIGASAFMIGRGPEHWHPDPAFFYEIGGGPMFDMGPYYLTALIALLGPIKRLSGVAGISYPERIISSSSKAGEVIAVTTPTHISSTLEFVSGAIGSLTTSFDAFGGTSLPSIEIYGSEGTLIVPDPNTFGGTVQLRKRDEEEFINIELTHVHYENSRGIGVSDMARAILSGQPHRASGKLAYHVLEAMHGIHDSSDNGTFYQMQSTCTKPEPLPVNYCFAIEKEK